MAFTHLHVHTEYSLLDGSNKIKEYVQHVKELGMNSAAITDHGVMFGVIDFYKTAQAAGIKPIIGCEVYVAPNSRFDREILGGEDRYHHLILLAENAEGYANLIKIVSKGFTEGYYYKPRVDFEVLETYHKGIIALSACLAGEVPRCLMRGQYEEAKQVALKYQACFGQNNYFLELQDHGIAEQKEVNTKLLLLSQELGIDLVATNDVHYTYEEDVDSHDVLLCIQTGKLVSDIDRMRYEGGQYFLKSEEQMKQLFPYALEALENTQKIADRCNVEIEFGVMKLPKYNVPTEYDASSYLRKICEDGLKERYPTMRDSIRDQVGYTLQERLDYELSVIEDMGYVDYFLIVWDYVDYAKRQNIIVGPGRGSAAGSIVSYCLKITDVDPIKYSLLFERFLNPERVSMPDIDIDFCVERRQEVIDYVVEKYGHDKVVQIITFGTMAARGVIRDVGRVLNFPYNYVDSIAKMIPTDLKMTIQRALEMNSELRQLYEQDEQVKFLIDMCRRLEGLPRHSSIHPAGVIICEQSIDELVPLSRGIDGAFATQFPAEVMEKLGLLKMDFLGLRNITVIQKTLENIERSVGQVIDMSTIDYEDQKVLASIGTGKTEGIFQLESAGMKSFMKELKPQSLDDIIAGISLYRPGPMDFIPQYIKGKNDNSNIQYSCPQLEPILAPTYGCIVYQEQVMQIARDLAGYTLGRSDLLRRAMSKKKHKEMEKERATFVYGNEVEQIVGCLANGIEKKVAESIYDAIMDFADYAFNKSHAVSYAVISYQTAYLKCYYPVEFMAALLTSVIDNPKKVAEYIAATREMGIELLPPDVNEGQVGFSVSKGAIRYALTAIKGVGKPLIEEMVEERTQHGVFATIQDFIARMTARDINKRAIENFIKSGTLDSLGGTRKQFMSAYAQILGQTQKDKKNALSGQLSLFDVVTEEQKQIFEVKMPDVGEFSDKMLLEFEKEVLGIYISGHPLQAVEAIWRKKMTATASEFQFNEEEQNMKLKAGAEVIIGGIIAEKVIKYDRKNQAMAFLQLEDLTGMVEVIVFAKSYEKYMQLLNADEPIFIYGRVSADDEKDGKLICNRIEEFTKDIWIQFSNKEKYAEQEKQLFENLKSVAGKNPVSIYLKEEKQIKKLDKKYNIKINEEVLAMLGVQYGADNVKVM